MENTFVTNSICSPSRACVLTGQYNHTNGTFDLGGRVAGPNQALPIAMKKAGYQTAVIGKWHLKLEPSSFDFYQVLPGQGKYFNPSFRVQGDKAWPENNLYLKGHSTDCITDLNLAWLKEKRDKDKPFFLMMHYKAPHDYFENAPRYETYLKDVDIPAPDSLWNSHTDEFGSIATKGADKELTWKIGTSVGPRNLRRNYTQSLPNRFPNEFPPKFKSLDLSDKEKKKMAYNAYLRKFLRCVKGIDDNVGRVLKYLEETGELDNTIVVYTADQGFMLGEHDYIDKRWMYDPSSRMPFLVRYPAKIKAGLRSDAMVENVDFAPTLIELAGGEVPETMQGKSFKSILETGKEPSDWKKEAYYRYWMHMAHHDNPGHVGIRTKTHKLIFYYGVNYKGLNQTPPGWELYDLTKDPNENVNQYDNPEYADTVKELKQRLADLRKRVGDDGSHHPENEKILQEFWDYDQADRDKAIAISHKIAVTKGQKPEIKAKPKKKKKGEGKKKAVE